MKTILFQSTLFLLAALFAPQIGSAQSAKASPSAVSRELRQKIAAARGEWKRQGGSEFKSGLTYVKGVPVLMLVTTKGEPADKAQRRRRELVSACEFLLEEGAFEKARICVVEAGPGSQTTTNYEIQRGKYQQAVKNAAKTAATKEGIGKARRDDAVLTAICTALEIK